MIFFYIYLVIFILLFAFLQLNYMFVWFENLMFDNAADSIFWGLLFGMLWPVSILVCLLFKLASYMEDVHNKHKK